MEIDETVPDAPIIENSHLVLPETKDTSKPSSILEVDSQSKEDTSKPSSILEVDSQSKDSIVKSAKETSNANQKIDEQNSEDVDDDLEIIEIPEQDPLTSETSVEKPVNKPVVKQSKIPTSTDAIVVLDDEEDEETNKAPLPPVIQQKNKLVDAAECEIIDLVPKKKCRGNSKCINYACASGANMTRAPEFCLSYYRVKNSENKKRQVCQDCYDAALIHYDELAKAYINGENLVDKKFPIRDDLVEIDDSDSEDEIEVENCEYFDDENMAFLEANFDSILTETMSKYAFQGTVKSSVDYLKKTAKDVDESYKEISAMVKEIRDCLDSVQYDLYNEFKCDYENLPPIDVMDVYYPQAKQLNRPPLPTIEPTKVEVERRSLRKVKPVSYAELDDPGSSNSPILTDNLKEGESAVDVPEPPPDLPPKGSIVKPFPKIGEMYYAVRFVTMGSWTKVRLVNILKPGTIVNGQPINNTMYAVSIENKQQKQATNKLVNGKEIAYATPCNVQLEVGARVIAVFRDIATAADNKKFKRDAYYPGIVAEPLSASNKYRYLIFFDDGYAQYVHHNMVHLIFESSKDVWEDMHVDSRAFIKKYLECYPERPMVKLRKDQTVRTEYNGKWWLTTVMNIDCSLVQMFFDSSSRIEWIYRGSTRLNPMFKEEQAATNRLQNKSRTPRKINAESEPYVQYTRNETPETSSAASTTVTPAAPVRSVAKKSTSKPVTITSNKNTIVSAVPFLPVGQQPTTIQTPPPSKVVYFTPRAQTNTKTLYKPHNCSTKCKSYITYDVSKLKGYNPLSKPLLCGWNRVTYRHKGKRTINYKAPCGRFIRSMQELHMYLRLTDSEMTVDLFDFDFWVHCLAEFVLERNSTINKDLSNGLEQVPIPVVNYNDSEINDFCNYSTKREPMEGVNLNLDPEFLCGCDCEDDCQDKMKCACWKLTLEGLKYLPKDVSPEFIGYTYRRLPEPVVTGIYECNSRCKCKSTCLNRVVQNPLQLKLQLFKTNNRGWGIRCLNDIPQGAFICIYAGSVLTEQMANEGGKNYGDEYLAELDYIEVVEKMKEDYEEEVYEEEEDDDKKSQRSHDVDDEEDDEEDKPIPLFLKNKKKNSYDFDDTDFVPSIVVANDDNSTIRTRLRRRNNNADDGDKNGEEKDVKEKKEKLEKKTKDEEDDTVTISDDEDNVREPSSFNPKADSNLDDTRPLKYLSVREIFAHDECIYVMDAKVTGNIGRFLNHSCSPNVFVQNVFVDTHDLRFPWVAFFALTYIRAGTELTWNYNYDVGSVPGKVMYCHCSSADCRGRLL